MSRIVHHASPFSLGDHAQEKLTGISGRIVGIAFYETGCTHIGIKRLGVDKEGKPFDLLWFDEPNVDLLSAVGDDDEALQPNASKKPGGPLTTGMSHPSGMAG